MIWLSSNGVIQLELTLKQAESAVHPGPCDADVLGLSELPRVKLQLEDLNSADVRIVLRECGAWDDTELSNHADNLQRILWIAAGDIRDRERERQRRNKR